MSLSDTLFHSESRTSYRVFLAASVGMKSTFPVELVVANIKHLSKVRNLYNKSFDFHFS